MDIAIGTTIATVGPSSDCPIDTPSDAGTPSSTALRLAIDISGYKFGRTGPRLAAARERKRTEGPSRLRRSVRPIVAHRRLALSASIMNATAVDTLTPRERNALLLMAQGYRVAEIGPRMGVSPSTVETHLKSARRKLGFSSSLLAARAVYGQDAPPGNLGSALSGMGPEDSTIDWDEPVPKTDPVGEQSQSPPTVHGSDRSSDYLGRTFGKAGNRNGLSRTERLIAWLVLSALVGIGAFASLAIPYLVAALRNH
jgi:DNA-binding CsgD family transcriptional regulator